MVSSSEEDSSSDGGRDVCGVGVNEGTEEALRDEGMDKGVRDGVVAFPSSWSLVSIPESGSEELGSASECRTMTYRESSSSVGGMFESVLAFCGWSVVSSSAKGNESRSWRWRDVAARVFARVIDYMRVKTSVRGVGTVRRYGGQLTEKSVGGKRTVR